MENKITTSTPGDTTNSEGSPSLSGKAPPKENPNHVSAPLFDITRTDAQLILSMNQNTTEIATTVPEKRIMDNKRNLSPGSTTLSQPNPKRTPDDNAINDQETPAPSVRDDAGQPDLDPDGRGYPVEVSNRRVYEAPTRSALVESIVKIKPPNTTIKEVLKTSDGRILVFAPTMQEYHRLLDSSRWDKSEGPVTTKIAPKQGSGNKAVVINNVDEHIQTDDILSALASQGFHATFANRLKRAKDGAPTRSVKAFIKDEKEIETLINQRFYYNLTRHTVTRYNAPKWIQCWKCQGLGHASNSCTAEEKKCMKCALQHHHRDCTANPDEYRCANCGGCHSSNDARCDIIKAAIQSTSHQQQQTTTHQQPSNASSGNQQQPRPPPPPPPLNAWGPPLNASENTLSEAPLTRTEIQHEISISIQRELATFGTTLLQGMAEVFKTGMRDIVSEFKDQNQRYQQRIYDLEKIISNSNHFANSFEKTIIENDVFTSTPTSSDRSQALGSNTAQTSSTGPSATSQLTQTEITEEPGKIYVHLPAAKIQLTKGSKKIDLEKLVKKQLKAYAKIMEKDVCEIMPEIRNRFSHIPPASQKSSTSTSTAPSTTSSETESDKPRAGKKKLATSSSRLMKYRPVQSNCPKLPPPHPLREST